MKTGTTIAALALIGAAAATASNPALADSKQPPHALTAPKAPSSFASNSQAAKPRSYNFDSKSGQPSNVMPPPAPTSDKK